MKEYTNSQIAWLIDEHIYVQIHRDILKSRYIDGLTYEKLSEKHEMSVKQIRNIIYKYEPVLFKYID